MVVKESRKPALCPTIVFSSRLVVVLSRVVFDREVVVVVEADVPGYLPASVPFSCCSSVLVNADVTIVLSYLWTMTVCLCPPVG